MQKNNILPQCSTQRKWRSSSQQEKELNKLWVVVKRLQKIFENKKKALNLWKNI